MSIKNCNHSFCNHIKNDSLKEEAFISILKEQGLTVTKPRLSILKALMSSSIPLTVDQLHSKLTGKFSCDMATVYRVMNQFVELKIVNSINFEKDYVHYEYNNPLHHHHHVICNQCKKIELIEECMLDQLELFLAKKGYRDLGHKLQFFGTCKNCSVA